MDAIASQNTSLTIVYSTVYSDVDQRKYQSSASLAFVRGIHRAGEFPAQMVSNAENVSIWCGHHEVSQNHVWLIKPRLGHLPIFRSVYRFVDAVT